MLLITPKEGCGHLGSGFGRMFYSCISFSEALSNARFFVFFTFCIADVTCDFFFTKETGHMGLSAQIVARFAV